MSDEYLFGYWLKQRRKGIDATQEQLARQIGCATSTLQKIETGRRRPSPQFAARLAEVLKISPHKRAAFVDFARGSQDPSTKEIFRPPTNLPAQSTPFIGRDHDVADVSKRLMQGDTRLVTLLGPPGIGKTRLSLKVATELRDRFDDGAFFVPLAPITDPDLVVPTIIKTLGLRESSFLPPLERLGAFLRFKFMLLVLDNFEQVVSAAPLVSELITMCSGIKLLVTSRVPLHLRAERRYLVPLLTLPELDPLPNAEDLLRCTAVALFVDRAEAVAPEFALTETNALAVATLCHRLDGLPLAIELISARINILSPVELLSRLHRRLLLQSGGLRDVDPRQRTLNNAINWSVNLLTSEERALYMRLGVFVAGWTLDAAESVQTCIGSQRRAAILDQLTSLVEKNLVIRLHVNGETRFTMLQIMREHALMQLEISGEAEIARHCHVAHYLGVIEAASPQLHASAKLIDRVEREHDNFCTALNWSLSQGQIETACRFTAALIWLWVIHTWHLNEGRKWLAIVLAAAREANLPVLKQARLHQDSGILAYLQGDHAAALILHQRALILARASKDKAMIAHALHGLSNVAVKQGQYDKVKVLLSECLPLARETGEKWLEAAALYNLAEMARFQNEFEQAGQMYEAGLGLLDDLNDKYFTPILLDGLGMLAQYQGDYEQAAKIHAQCLALCQEMGDRRMTAQALERLAGVAVERDDAGRAARLLGAAQALREIIHVPIEAIDLQDYERFVAETHARLDEDTLAKAWTEGRSMGFEQVIVYALSDM